MAHPPRIPVWLPADQPVIYFITFCVAGRLQVLANAQVFSAFLEATGNGSRWTVLAGVLMPDHVHLLAAPQDRDRPPGDLSARIKRRIRKLTEAAWRWQAGCFDRLLRSDESAEEKWQYIRENPVRAGLVRRWEDWPYRVGFEL